MNRKERRAALKQGKGAPNPGAAAEGPARDLFASAVRGFHAGQLGDAERLCREALAFDPRFFDALHLLGFITFQAGRHATAAELLGKAAELNRRSPECHFHLALALHGAGRIDAAAAHFREAASLKSDFAAAHMNLGNVLMQQGKADAARTAYERVLALEPGSADAHLNLGNALMRLAQQQDALKHYRRAAELAPGHPGAHINEGAALLSQGRVAEAVESFRRAAALAPQSAEAQQHLADALLQFGETDDAEAAYRRALVLQPNAAGARHGLANLKLAQGAFAEAAGEYQRILALQPDNAEVRSNLGIALAGQGRFAEAEAEYRSALAIQPKLVDVYRNLGRLVLAQGDAAEALRLARQALDIEETIEAKVFFVECAKKLPDTPAEPEFRTLVVRAVAEGWSRPSELAGLAPKLFALNDVARSCLDRAVRAWPRPLTETELFEGDGLAVIASDPLLRALLESEPIRTIELERLLTALRRVLLDRATASDASTPTDQGLLEFFCALARQGFTNEYAFARGDDERDRVEQLQARLDAALAAAAPIPPLWPVAIAAYLPLHALERAEALLQRQWPQAIEQLLSQQVQEALEERDIRPSVRPLTAIEDEVSLQVRSQYEEMPYPRWIRTAPIGKPIAIDWYLRNRFPAATIRALGKRDPLEILVAGCGTGQHSIETARRFAAAQVLAIDLSLTSLTYAMRKTRALGLTNIEYRHADILKLGTIGRSFDIIEASGVLHHLRDPAEGWRVLLSLLRPGGLMNVGLYSALARADIRAARAFIAERGYGRSADDIRKARQDMIAATEGSPLRALARFPDFFTTSECRDLLFHVQEHQLTIPEIKSFIETNGLTFLGFGGDADASYRQGFPQDLAMTNLDNWHIFETENPLTFVGMYQFWVQKQ